MLGIGPARAQREADAAVVVRRHGLAVVGGTEDVETRRHGTVHEVGLGEAEIDQGAQRAERNAEPQFLALAEQVALLDRDVAQDARSRRVAGAEGDVAGALLDHLDLEIGLVRRRSGRGRDVDLLEEAEVAQALLAAPHLGGAEGVALGETELAADHLVEGARVAGDVDALDINARAFLDVEGDVDREIVLVAPDIGPDLDEGVTQRANEVGQRRHGLLDLVGVVPFALSHRQVALQHIDIQPLETRRHLDLAELVAIALADREGDEEPFAVRRQLGHRRHHAEVGIALGQVVLAQQLAIEIEAVGIVAVVRRQEAIPDAFAGADLAAQRAVAEMLVADETDALNAGYVAFVDLEDQVDAALLELDDPRLDRAVLPAAG